MAVYNAPTTYARYYLGANYNFAAQPKYNGDYVARRTIIGNGFASVTATPDLVEGSVRAATTHYRDGFLYAKLNGPPDQTEGSIRTPTVTARVQVVSNTMTSPTLTEATVRAPARMIARVGVSAFDAYTATTTRYPFVRPIRDLIGSNQPHPEGGFQSVGSGAVRPRSLMRRDPQVVSTQNAPAVTYSRMKPTARLTRRGTVSERTRFRITPYFLARNDPHIRVTLDAPARTFCRPKPRTLLNIQPVPPEGHNITLSRYRVWKPRANTSTAVQHIPTVFIQPMEFAMNSSALISSVLIYRTSFYVPPAPEVPDPEDVNPPAYGGTTIRALHGKIVDMDTPTVIDGVPYS